MDPHSPAFKKLASVWNKKLKDSGFVDIEDKNGRLKLWTSHYFRTRYTPSSFAARQEYYRMAGQFLHTHVFDSPAEKELWRLHSDGLAAITIYRQLKKRRLFIARDAVHKTIHALAKVMLREATKRRQRAEN